MICRSMFNPEGKRATEDIVSYGHEGIESQSYMGTEHKYSGEMRWVGFSSQN